MSDSPAISSGYQALHGACAWFDLDPRGRIRAKGEDRARLLHAMTTNHVQGLAVGQGCYAFFLNAQGRILGDVNLFVRPEEFLLDTEPETREKLFAHLDRYIIADDVTLEDASAATFCLALEGPKAADQLDALGAPVPAADGDSLEWGQLLVAKVSATGQQGFRIFGPAADRNSLAASLNALGIPEADKEVWEAVRIENGLPRYGEDITESSLPQETRQLRALHFQKGCYLGQEIVERVRSRGHVNRVLASLRILGTSVPQPGAKINADGKEVGTITSAAWSPASNAVAAIANIRVEALEGQAPLSVNELPAERVGR